MERLAGALSPAALVTVLRRNRTIGETVAELARRNIRISASEVRELVARFIVSLGIAHTEAAPRLRQCLREAGGYILHLDSTCKGGSAHLLTGIDEISGFVLLNAKVPGESNDEVSAFLRLLIERFGPPAAVSCDMARGILAAELPGTPVFICHFHFPRDLGKDLMAKDYDLIRQRLRHHGLKAELKRMRREMRDVVSANAGRLKSLPLAIESGRQAPEPVRDLPCTALLGAFTASLLDAEDQGDGYGFPFDRPHLLFFRQAQAVLAAVEALRQSGLFKDPERKLCQRFISRLRPICSDHALAAAAAALEEKAKTFDLMRQAMRIAEPGTGRGLNDPGAEAPISTIKHQVDVICKRFRGDAAFMGREKYRAMLGQIDKYRNLLFADPIRIQPPQGLRILQPRRTNNILERFFRDLNRQGCKRTGRRTGETYLNRLLPDTPLVANPGHPRCLERLLDGCETLAPRLARIDQKLVDRTLAELRQPPTGLDRKLRAQLRIRATPIQIALFFLGHAA